MHRHHFFEYPPSVTHSLTGLTPARYGYRQYKDELEGALVARFGRENVDRGNKAFDIHENAARVDADAVACFEFRLYYRDAVGQLRWHSGTALLTDREMQRITNFPRQQYENGVAKNDATGRRFKSLVRILKRLRNEMEEEGDRTAEPIASFLIESLSWNWPNEQYNNQPSWAGMVKAFLIYTWAATINDASCSGWTEVNGIKPLFGPHNGWTRQQVNEFALAAISYIGRR